MNLMNRIRGKPKTRTFILTPLGRTKAESFDMPQAKWQVLASLKESGPCNTREIATNTNMSDEKVTAVLRSLASDGYVRLATGVEE